jgi:3-oxoacyl-[acyl-carrier protein] reductase
MTLNGKTALITGAAAGLGRPLRRLFATSTRRVLPTRARPSKGLGAECLPLHRDVASSRHVSRVFEKACSRFDTVHVLVNNAAMVPEHSIRSIASIAPIC